MIFYDFTLSYYGMSFVLLLSLIYNTTMVAIVSLECGGSNPATDMAVISLSLYKQNTTYLFFEGFVYLCVVQIRCFR